MRILEEFWYGNIKPTEYDAFSCKEYKFFRKGYRLGVMTMLEVMEE